MKNFVLTACLFFTCYSTQAQSITIVKGVVKDYKSGLPLPNINVSVVNHPIKTRTDAQGYYEIRHTANVKQLRFSGISYQALVKEMVLNTDQTLNVRMEQEDNNLSEVAVSAAKTPRYRNKNNPAVDFMHQVIAHKEENSAKVNNTIAFTAYEKLCLSLNFKKEKATKSMLLKRFPFLLQHIDSIKHPNQTLVPIFMQEKVNKHIYSGDPIQKKVVAMGEKQSRIDQYIDEDGINEYLDKIYQDIDLYKENIGIGNQSFLSPIANLATGFYKYFIIDTLKDVLPHQLKIMVAPKNKEDVLFLGYLYVSLDGHYALQKATLSINTKININWVKALTAEVAYKTDPEGHYHLSKSILGMDLGLSKNGTGLYGERTVLNDDFVTGTQVLAIKPDSLMKITTSPDLLKTDFWEQVRPEKLSETERMAYKNIDSLKNSAKFKHTMAVGAFLISGYIPAGPLDLGPFNSFYSFNTVEGNRLRFGARTNEFFSKKIVLDGHLAYGLKDKQWKYSMGAIYSLTPRSVYEFPVRSVTVRHSFETQIPGQDLNFLEDDNFLLSFKRGHSDKWIYNKKSMIEYLHETKDHLSFKLGYQNQVMTPLARLNYTLPGPEGGTTVPDLTLSEFNFELRWAPHEQFYQGKKFRRIIKNEYPILTLRATAGFKGFLNGDYDYQKISLNGYKRFYWSQFGYSDVIAEAGAVFGKVPFPLLVIHRANQTYAYQLPSYNLMNFMEFMSDRYASINVQHSFNGFFLNKVPLIKKLKFREMVSLKVLTGDISSKNAPGQGQETFSFPTDRDGRPSTFTLNRSPYIEGSVGLSNIFKVLRVDYVRRFTHLSNPGIDKSGIRVRLQVDF